MPEYSKDYWRGVKDGIRRYAYWRDGVEYVGSYGNSLADALREVDEECGFDDELETERKKD